MAQFLGSISGARGEATRLGHKTSGLRTEACSWQGRVSVLLWYNEVTGLDMAHVSLEQHHGHGTSRELYDGPVSGDPEVGA